MDIYYYRMNIGTSITGLMWACHAQACKMQNDVLDCYAPIVIRILIVLGKFQ